MSNFQTKGNNMQNGGCTCGLPNYLNYKRKEVDTQTAKKWILR